MFSRILSLFSSSGAGAARDLSFGLLNARQVVPLVKDEKWEQLEQLARALSSDELSRLLDGICLTDRFNKQILPLGKQKEQEFARLVLGAWHLYQAWQARSGLLAKDVSKSQMEGFEHYLLLARVLLGGTFATPAFLGEARARLIRVEMGLNEPDRAMAAFHQSVAVDARKFWAHHHVFKLSSPKWLGSEEELVGYIQSVQDGALRYALWLMFLVEMYSDANLEDESSALQRWHPMYESLLKEVLAQPPLPVDGTLVSIYANNNLAYLYHLAGEREKRNSTLTALNGHYSPYPWDYFGIDTSSAAAMKAFQSSLACRP
ncbi:hypothetical protein [Hymenobacter metallilatus]|uniref:DUF4034 domain-containing protein n=1 Tax=Hymenobacter metallilatus TaxID=2493666 RepID=A0A3R9PGA2_9BACT|nr:hypothetical protein [Hymenobacter metallilatus]RSK37387.1 hypothetical protein EI290_01675 [Hymenobacter metallilatus]